MPQLWAYEFSNGLRKSVRRKTISKEEAEAALDSVQGLVTIETRLQSSQVLLALAHDNNLSVYHAAYLDLALRLNLPLATLDKQLERAAIKNRLPSHS